MLDLRRLKYFVAIAEAGAIVHAAARLGVAQSALSGHVATLERDLGVALLVRRARGVHLTEAGERFLGHARGVLRLAEQAEEDVRSLSREIAGPVAIGLAHTAIEGVAARVLRLIHDNAPGVALRMAEGLSSSLRQWMLSGEIDLALAFLDSDDAQVQSTPLLEEDLVCIGVPRYLGRHNVDIRFEEVSRLPLVLPGRIGVAQAMLPDPVIRQQLASQVRLEVESLSALKAAVSMGLGCSLQSCAAIAREVSAGAFTMRRVVDPHISRRLYLLASRLRLQARAVREARAQVAQAVAQAHDAGEWPGRALPGLTRVASEH